MYWTTDEEISQIPLNQMLACRSKSRKTHERDLDIYANMGLVEGICENVSKDRVFCCSTERTWKSTGDLSRRSLEGEELCLPHKQALKTTTSHILPPLHIATCISSETLSFSLP